MATTPPRRRMRRRGASTAVAGLALSGCAMLNPYDEVQQRNLVQPEAGMRLAGQANEALAAADAMRHVYFNNLKYTAYVRSSTTIVATALTGWALYHAFEPTTDGVATDGHTRFGLRLAVSLGALYGLREFFVNAEQEQIHAEGYRALTCLMLQSAPLLMTEFAAADPVLPLAASAAQPAGAGLDRFLPPRAKVHGLGDLDRLQHALDRLERGILRNQLLVAEAQARSAAMTVDNADLHRSHRPLLHRIDEAGTALERARRALYDGRSLVAAVQASGRTINDRIGVVVSVVNEQVRSKQKFDKAADVLKNAQDITTNVLKIGDGTAADQTDVLPGSTGASNLHAPQSILLAGPMDAAAGLLLADARVAQRTPAGAGAAAQPAACPASASGSCTAPPTVRPKQKPPQPTAAVQPPTKGELQQIRDKLDAAISAIGERETQAALAAAKSADARALGVRERQLRESIDRLNDAQMQCGGADRGIAGCSIRIAEANEVLYALRRPVVQALTDFRAKVRAAAATPECNALAPLRVTPNEVLRAYRGDSLSYVISQRAAGNPVAVLEGPDNERTGVSFKFTPVPGTSPSLFNAQIKVGPEMPRQTIRLHVSDASGAASQTIFIAAGGDRPGEARDSAAAVARSASAAASAAAEAAAAAAKAAAAAASAAAALKP